MVLSLVLDVVALGIPRCRAAAAAIANSVAGTAELNNGFDLSISKLGTPQPAVENAGR
jgi:hypothetical protein